jgi:hypothetical protein
MVKTEDNRTLFIKLIDWLLTKFPNDPTLMYFKSCKIEGHEWELWHSMARSKYSSYKTIRNYYKCSKCGKERKNL